MPETMENTSELKTYRGNCHCGAFKFSIKVAEIKQLPVCNCSICTRNGLLWIYPVADEDLIIECGQGKLTSYEFGTKTTTHWFCPKCGSSIRAHPKDPEKKVGGINARVLKDLDLDTVQLQPFRGGADLGAEYQRPALPSWQGEVEEGLKTYQGNCHCGAVTYAVKTKALEELKIMNCNCSSCSRNSDLWIYPSKQAVQLHGSEKLTEYVFLHEDSKHSFCSTCGTSMVVKVTDPNEDIMPLNVRTIDGIDLEALVYEKYDGKSNDPQYLV